MTTMVERIDADALYLALVLGQLKGMARQLRAAALELPTECAGSLFTAAAQVECALSLVDADPGLLVRPQRQQQLKLGDLS